MIYAAFILGFLGSIHCLGMCGPLTLALPIPRERRVIGITIYNVGRTITYASFGLVFGILGESLSIAGWQKGFAIGMAVLILLLIFLPGLSNGIVRNYQESRFIKAIKKSIIVQFKNRSFLSSFVAGTLNGFIPCGLVYIALAGALATGSIQNSIIFMAFFGIGTIPALLGLNVFKAIWKIRFSSKWMVPAFSLLFAGLFLYRGIAVELPAIENLLNEVGFKNITICNGGF